jgi:hypothetical protein
LRIDPARSDNRRIQSADVFAPESMMKDRLVTIALSVATTLGVLKAEPERLRELDVDRLIVRKELIVSDTGSPWEAGFEEHQIPRGIYAKSATDDAVGGLWVRSRLIKGEIDDPFDDRFHALERDGRLRQAPGHISWNVWLDGAWRQMAIIQGEGLEPTEVPPEQWNGGTHPGRLRFQTFRPGHGEPLTDALIGQGKMSLGGGGYGGGGLPLPSSVLELWGGTVHAAPLAAPEAPTIAHDDGSGPRKYSLIAVGPQGQKTAASPAVQAQGLATLRWDSVPGADAYIILRDGQPITDPVRIEGSQKEWQDRAE